MNHYRKTVKIYRARRKATVACPFCDLGESERIEYRDELVSVIANLTKYDLWELHDVEDHLMIIPNRHVESFKEMTDDERLAVMAQIAKYEASGYNIYARGNGFIKRSVKHQHTHLIKVSNKKPKLSVFVEKPYFLIKK